MISWIENIYSISSAGKITKVQQQLRLKLLHYDIKRTFVKHVYLRKKKELAAARILMTDWTSNKTDG